MSEDLALFTRGLVKWYGNVRAVDGIDLEVPRGKVYGFLGRNGAGKTTTIRMLLGLVRPSAGEVVVLGSPIRPGSLAVLKKVGYLVETPAAYPNLTVCENLDIQRRLLRVPRQYLVDVVELLGLARYRDLPAGKLSLGNKQRLSLARALLHRPELLLLDEPVNGLDPAGIVEIRELLRSLADRHGVTVFLSSHNLSEIAHLADRIGIIHEGRMITDLSREVLHGRLNKVVEIDVSEPGRAASLLTSFFGETRLEQTPEGCLRLFDHFDRTADITRILVEGGLDVTRLCTTHEDLEDYFLRLTGGAA